MAKGVETGLNNYTYGCFSGLAWCAVLQLFRQRVGVPKSSAAESYVMLKEPHLWEHMKKYRLEHIEDGIQGLK